MGKLIILFAHYDVLIENDDGNVFLPPLILNLIRSLNHQSFSFYTFISTVVNYIVFGTNSKKNTL